MVLGLGLGQVLIHGEDGAGRGVLGAEAANKYYDELPEIVEEYMGKINAKLGTDYQLFNYYGAPDAEGGVSLEPRP